MDKGEQCQRRRTVDLLELGMTICVVTSLLLFLGLYYWKPTFVQYTGPDKRPTGTVNSFVAIGFAIATAVLITLTFLMIYVGFTNQNCA